MNVGWQHKCCSLPAKVMLLGIFSSLRPQSPWFKGIVFEIYSIYWNIVLLCVSSQVICGSDLAFSALVIIARLSVTNWNTPVLFLRSCCVKSLWKKRKQKTSWARELSQQDALLLLPCVLQWLPPESHWYCRQLQAGKTCARRGRSFGFFHSIEVLKSRCIQNKLTKLGRCYS